VTITTNVVSSNPVHVIKDTHFDDFLSKEALCIFNDCSKTYSYLGIYSNSAIDINISDHFIFFFLNSFLGNLHFTTTTKNPLRHKQRKKTLISLCIQTNDLFYFQVG
jgi:hypothetical protein